MNSPEDVPPPRHTVYDDNKIVGHLFAALRSSIPPDVRLTVIQRCSDELKFIMAVQPRVSSFSSRRRHSIRHPALSMATKYYYCRQRQIAEAEKEEQSGDGGDYSNEGLDSSYSVITATRRKSQFTSRGNSASMFSVHGRSQLFDESWGEFGMGMSNATWNFRRPSQAPVVDNYARSRLSVSAPSMVRSLTSVVRSYDDRRRSSYAGGSRRRSDIALRDRIRSRLQGIALNAADKSSSDSELIKFMPNLKRHRASNMHLVGNVLDSTEEEEYLLYQQNEDFRWDQLAFCYDQMLRTAEKHILSYVQLASQDARVNDIIRRFWDRVTVSPAAQEARHMQEMLQMENENAQFKEEEKKRDPKVTFDAGKKKKKKKVARKHEVLASTASYMSPLQYVYLNMRICNVLLPSSRELELEMLESIQEDLIVDATYNEDDDQALYFGRAPGFVVPANVSSQRKPSRDPLLDDLNRKRPSGSDWRNLGWGGENDEGSVAGAVSTDSFAEATVKDCAVATWDPTRLPHLNYGQFWASMLELADNWTSTAAHPAEYAAFLMELYVEVFGHNFDEEDPALAEALQASAAQLAAETTCEEEVEKAIREFHELMDNVIEEYSESASERGLEDSRDAFFSPPLSDDDLDSLPSHYSSCSSMDSVFSLLDATEGEWEYFERVDENGVVHRWRRKKVRIPRKRRGDEDLDHSSLGDSQWIIEEEVDENGNVIRRRRLHKRDKKKGEHEKKKRTKKIINEFGEEVEVEETDSESSWSSYEDSLTGKGRRKKTRRHHRRKAVNDEDGDEDEEDSDDDGDLDDPERKRKKKKKKGGKSSSKSSGKTGDKRDKSGSKSANKGKHTGEDDDDSSDAVKEDKNRLLSAEERKELLSRKDWLKEMLAKQGIHIKDSAFLDPNEEGLLYQLLKAAEKIEERRQKREQEGGGGGGGEDEEDDFGTAMFDVGLLAELLSRPTVFSIDDLGRSELMRRLLESDDDLAKSLLTPDQMDSVIAALMQSGSKGAQETATLRRRRLQLLEEARRMKDAAEKAKRDAEAAANNQPAVEENKDTFDLTEVALPEKEPQPEEVRQKTPSRPTSGAPSHGELVNDMDRIISPIERPSSKGKKPPPPPFVLRPDEISEAQRREQELLFQQFEEFVAEQESQVVYKVTFHEYSPEQLEAFFRKLHLGPQQQALLRGRAPLASNISLDGGTYHQLPTISRPTKTTVGFQFGSSMPRVTTDQVSVPVKVAPVKLFTLTAQDDIQGAIRENFHSYLDDRSYQMALRQRSELPAQRTIPEEMRDPMERGSHLPPTDSQKRVGRGFNFSKPEPTPESQAEEKANASSTPPIPPLTSGKTLPPLTKRNP